MQGHCIYLEDTVEKNNFACKWSRKQWNNSFKTSFSNKKGKQKEVSQLGSTGDISRVTISHGWIRKFFSKYLRIINRPNNEIRRTSYYSYRTTNNCFWKWTLEAGDWHSYKIPVYYVDNIHIYHFMFSNSLVVCFLVLPPGKPILLSLIMKIRTPWHNGTMHIFLCSVYP